MASPKPKTYVDDNYALFPKSGSGVYFKDNSEASLCYRQIDGWVETPHGYVRVWAHAGKSYRYSSLTMLKNGREYRRRFTQFYKRTALVTLAKRFAEELYAKPPSDTAKYFKASEELIEELREEVARCREIHGA